MNIANTPLPPNCPSPPSHLTPWPTSVELGAFNQWIASLGPRFTATDPHRCLLYQIRQTLAPLVASGNLSEERIPARDSTAAKTFTNWLAMSSATSPSLALGASPAKPAAGYMPYTGLTDAAGVTAPLVVEKPGFLKELIPLLNLLFPFKFKPRHRGKIVAVCVPSVKFPKWFLKYLSRNSRSDFSHWAPYRRTIVLELLAPCPNKAADAGVRGLVLVLDMSPSHAEKQYLPFSRPVPQPVGQGVPGIHVDCTELDDLEAHAASGGDATIVLRGAVEPEATSEHLLYTLPGALAADPTRDEIVLVQTHTDGPSAIEENGVMALIALAHRFAAMPIADRRRTLKFLFATGHFVKEIEGAKDVIQANNPPWLQRTKVSVAIEHLGTKEWVDDCEDGYRVRTTAQAASQRDEPALLFVTGGEHPLEKLAHSVLPKARRIVLPSRDRMLRLKRKFFGEGQYVACTGVPTVGYLPNPNYMFSYADPGGAMQRGHLEKLDPARMKTELDAFWDLTHTLVTDALGTWQTVTPDVAACQDPETVCD